MRDQDMEAVLPVHPGTVLRERFLQPAGLTSSALAIALQVPAPRINEIVRERRGVTADTALRLARYFGNAPEFWMGLQDEYDLAVSRASLGDALERIMPRAAIRSDAR
ncbi:HigA family addiction module antidote protein [Oxalobacter sp. OttesenSCG-928-P03]|nr:HigA family addiction module antidote protein [Oxalobacter sp. OttesenSCG-928-P03]